MPYGVNSNGQLYWGDNNLSGATLAVLDNQRFFLSAATSEWEALDAELNSSYPWLTTSSLVGIIGETLTQLDVLTGAAKTLNDAYLNGNTITIDSTGGPLEFTFVDGPPEHFQVSCSTQDDFFRLKPPSDEGRAFQLDLTSSLRYIMLSVDDGATELAQIEMSGNSGVMNIEATGVLSVGQGSSELALLSSGDITFDDQHLTAAIAIGEATTGTGLTGFTATSIVGALNEVKDDVGSVTLDAAYNSGATINVDATGGDLTMDVDVGQKVSIEQGNDYVRFSGESAHQLFLNAALYRYWLATNNGAGEFSSMTVEAGGDFILTNTAGIDLLTTGDHINLRADYIGGNVNLVGGNVELLARTQLHIGVSSSTTYGDHAIRIGTSTNTGRTIEVGNTGGTTSLSLKSGSGALAIEGAGAVTFNDQYLTAAIPISQSGVTALVGFTTATSIVGALNEVKGTTITTTPTPVDNQVAVWTSGTDLEGTAGLLWDGSTLTVQGTISNTTGILTIDPADSYTRIGPLVSNHSLPTDSLLVSQQLEVNSTAWFDGLVHTYGKIWSHAGIQSYDNVEIVFGSGTDAQIDWCTTPTSADDHQLRIGLGGATATNMALSLMDYSDRNTTVGYASTTPALLVHNNDVTKYVSLYHDGTDGVFATSSGGHIHTTRDSTATVVQQEFMPYEAADENSINIVLSDSHGFGEVSAVNNVDSNTHVWARFRWVTDDGGTTAVELMESSPNVGTLGTDLYFNITGGTGTVTLYNRLGETVRGFYSLRYSEHALGGLV